MQTSLKSHPTSSSYPPHGSDWLDLEDRGCMYSQGSQCSVSAPEIGHLLIATLLGYDLKMKNNIGFDYSLGGKKK